MTHTHTRHKQQAVASPCVYMTLLIAPKKFHKILFLKNDPIDTPLYILNGSGVQRKVAHTQDMTYQSVGMYVASGRQE